MIRPLSMRSIILLIHGMVLLFSSSLYGAWPQFPWRDAYQNKVFGEMLKLQSRNSLMGYQSANLSISKALQIIKEDKGEITLKILQSIEVPEKSDVPDQEAEVAFIKGLLYESLGFYPEAMGNYARIIQYYSGTAFFRKAMLRTAFVKLNKSMESNENRAILNEAKDEFYKVYEESSEAAVWKDALAGYAIALHRSHNYQDAEDVFQKIDTHVKSSTVYEFFSAENNIKLNKPREAAALFQRLPERYVGPLFLSYVMLRLGDIAVMEGKESEGESFYKRLTSGNGLQKDKDKKVQPASEDGLIMGTIALSELYMKKSDKRRQAIGLLKGFLENEPNVHAADDAIFFYLTLLYHDEGNYDAALLYAKRFLSSYNSGHLKDVATDILNSSGHELISAAYKKDDCRKVLTIYYRNRGFLKNKTILMKAGDCLLRTGIPSGAKEVFETLQREKDIYGLTGLAASYIMTGDSKRGMEILKSVPLKDEVAQKDVARVFMLLGDHQFRKGNYNGALSAYLEAQKELDDPHLFLKAAYLYNLAGKQNEAEDIYNTITARFSETEIGWTAWLGLGDIYYSRGMWKEAVAAYERGLAVFEKSGRERWHIIYRIGEANMRLGNVEGAKTAWEEVAKKDGDYLGRLAAKRVKEAELWRLKARM